jgi:hypothetical protein
MAGTIIGATLAAVFLLIGWAVNRLIFRPLDDQARALDDLRDRIARLEEIVGRIITRSRRDD